jgi:small subunit ribosomal protein S9
MSSAKKAVHAIGKRKTAIARVWVRPGKGQITVNNRTFDDYFLRPTSKMVVMQPLELTQSQEKYDIKVNVLGGGLNGQAGAIRHAVSRALQLINPELRAVLKGQGLLSRDARKKERKMYGLKSSRARFQFSKR